MIGVKLASKDKLRWEMERLMCSSSGSRLIYTLSPTFPPFFLSELGLGFFSHMQPKESIKKENSVAYSILYILVDFAFFFIFWKEVALNIFLKISSSSLLLHQGFSL